MPSSSEPHQDPKTSGPRQPAPDEQEDFVPDHGLPRLSRLNLSLLGLSIVSMCAALYLSPMGQDATADVRESVAEGTSSLLSVPTSPSPTPSPVTTAPTTAPSVTPAVAKVIAPPSSPAYSPSASSGYGNTSTGGSNASTGLTGSGGNDGKQQGAANGNTSDGKGKGKGKDTGKKADQKTKKRIEGCWSFTWQQDAQAYYVGNLSDPLGLDGAKGPYNGDGLACAQLPVDPTRTRSAAVGAYVPPKPTAATKVALVNPAKDYFGFSQDGIPGDTAMLKSLAATAKKAPSSVGWFSDFDHTYRGDLVETAWSHGSLPVISWMPIESGSGNSYSATRIINGEWDAYLRRYAVDIVKEDLPVALRFAHEMNGNWYGWSAGMTSWNNSPAKFIAAWRHIHDIFEEVGANENVIWLWSPSRIDELRVAPGNGLTNIADVYPGDDYVDWVGASIYMRYKTLGPTYQAAFGRTVAALEAVTDKPIFFAETAAVQSDGATDLTTVKAQWIRNALTTFATNDRIVGFLWFNNIATIPVNGQEVHNDWRVESSPDALHAFQDVIALPQFASGVVPD